MANKYTLILFFQLFLLCLLFSGCLAPVKKPEEEEIILEPKQIMLIINVDKENLRAAPNGVKIGEAIRGESFLLLLRRGNWCEIKHPNHETCWIWAPSVGFPLINPLNLNFFFGISDSSFTDNFMDRFGQPTEESYYSSRIVIYRYRNMLEGGTTLFGTDRFHEIRLWIHRATLMIICAEIELPPFEGEASSLLTQLGLPNEMNSTLSNFDFVRYDAVFRKIARLDLNRLPGDLTKFQSVIAHRYDPIRWRETVQVREKSARQNESSLEVVLTLVSRDRDLTYVAPIAEISLTEDSRMLGRWEIGPVEAYLAPWDTVKALFNLPVDTGTLNLSALDVSAKLTSLTPVPTLYYTPLGESP